MYVAMSDDVQQAIPVSPTRYQNTPTVGGSWSGTPNGRRSPVRNYSPTRSTASPSSLSGPRALSPTYSFKSNGKNDDRSGYIRAVHKPNDLYYDLPGMADLVKRSGGVKGPRFDVMSADRTSYMTSGKHGPTGLYYDLPGMAARPSSRSVDFSRGGERKSRDLLGQSNAIHPASPIVYKETRDLVYDLPGMADAISLSRKGSACFRMTSARMLSPRPTAAHDVLARSDAGTIAHEAASTPRDKAPSPLRKSSNAASASFRMTSPRFGSPSKTSSARFQVEAYELPGMASEALKSPRGTASFRNSSGRDSYIKAFPKKSDLIYDLPGMSGVVYGSVLSSPAASRAGSRIMSPTRKSPHRTPHDTATFGPRFASPTKSSAAREHRPVAANGSSV